MQIILGLSPGTRSMGTALFYDNHLIDYGTYVLRGVWSERKLEAVLRRLTLLIDTNEVTAIAIKIPDKAPTTPAFKQLIGAMNGLFEAKGTQVHYYTLRDLKEHCLPGGEITKDELAGYMAAQFQELEHKLPKGKVSARQSKLFEAVCAGGMAYRTQ